MSHHLRDAIKVAEREARDRAANLAKPKRTARELGILLLALLGLLLWLGGYASGRGDIGRECAPAVNTLATTRR